MVQAWFYAWNPIASNSNLELLSRLLFYAPLIMLSSSIEIFERAIFFGMFFSPAFIMWVITFKLLNPLCKKQRSVFVASFVASLAYTLNPFYLFAGRIDFNLTYAFLPALFYLTVEIFKEETYVRVIQNAFLLSIIISFPIYVNSIHGIAYALTLVIYVTITELILHIGKSFRKYSLRAFLVLFMVVVMPILVNAYAILPYVMSGISSISGPQIAGGRLQYDLLTNFSLTPFYALIASYHTRSPEIGFTLIDEKLVPYWLICYSAIAILSYLSMNTMMTKNEFQMKLGLDIISMLSFLVIISSFLSFVMFTPLRTAYVWSLENIPYAWGLLQFPYSFTFYTSLVLAFFLGFFLAYVCERMKNLKIIIISVITISITILFTAYPLLISGNFMNILNPSPIPEEYVSANEFLLSDQEAFRTLWLPEHGQLKTLPHGHPVAWYTSTVPLLIDRIAVGTDAYKSFCDVRTVGNLERPDKALLRDLGFMSVKYIVYQANTTLSNAETLDYLLRQDDLQLVFHKNSIWIFKNTLFQPFIRSSNQSITLDYAKVNPTKWMVNVKAGDPFTLVFAEPNDKNWEAFIGGNKLTKTQIYPLFNAFMVDKTGEFTVTIEYKPQKYMEAGACVSVVTLLLLGIAYFKLSTRSNRRKHYINAQEVI